MLQDIQLSTFVTDMNEAISNFTSKTKKKNKTPWPLVRKGTIPTELPPLVGEI
jgi:hypothetical protein